MGYLFEDNPALGLAVEYGDDVCWKTCNLYRPTPYGLVAPLYYSGLAAKGATIEDLQNIHPVVQAWNQMIRSAQHPLGPDDANDYRIWLAHRQPIPDPPHDPDPEHEAWLTLRTYWPTDPRLAALCTNHALIHTHTGLCAVFPDQAQALADAVKQNDEEFFRVQAIMLPPGGLSRARLAA